MLKHFFSFQKRLDCSNELPLDLAMGEHNINSLFEKKLNKSFQENDVKFLNIGLCSFQKVHNALRKGLSCLTIDLDQLACNFSFFK